MSRLALFDLDNTLIDRESAYRRWAVKFCHEQRLPNASVERLVNWDNDGYRSRVELFRHVKSELDLADSIDDLVDAYRENYPRSYVRDQTTIDSLRALRSAGYKVGIVTNGPSSQATKIRLTGLMDLVDAYCISEVHGSPKPELSIFKAVAEMAGCTLDGWMIGDSPEADIAGGRCAGLKTIWLARGREWSESDFAPDYICHSLRQVVEHLLQNR